MGISASGKNIRFDEHHLVVDLADGRIIATPLTWYPELSQASLVERSHWQFICNDTGIEWTDLDYHLSIESMLLGIPGSMPNQVA